MAEPLNRTLTTINLGKYDDKLIVDDDGWAMLGDYKVRLVRRDSEGRITTDNLPNVERIDQYARAFLSPLQGARRALLDGKSILFNATHLETKGAEDISYTNPQQHPYKAIVSFPYLPQSAQATFGKTTNEASSIVYPSPKDWPRFKAAWKFMLESAKRSEDSFASTMALEARTSTPAGPPPPEWTQNLRVITQSVVTTYNKKNKQQLPTLDGPPNGKTFAALVLFANKERPSDLAFLKDNIFEYARNRMQSDLSFKADLGQAAISIIEAFVRPQVVLPPSNIQPPSESVESRVPMKPSREVKAAIKALILQYKAARDITLQNPSDSLNTQSDLQTLATLVQFTTDYHRRNPSNLMQILFQYLHERMQNDQTFKKELAKEAVSRVEEWHSRSLTLKATVVD